MKAGRSLQDLVIELDRRAKSKKDYLCPTQAIRLEAKDEGKIVLEGVNGGMELNGTAHAQLAATLGIPKAYYDLCLQQAPDLLATNVNRWLKDKPATKLVRTLDDRVRAILSDSYRPLDNFDLAEAVLPKLQDLDAHVVSGEVTDSRFYLKAVTPKIAGVVGKIRPHQAGDSVGMIDDIVQAGVVISNSEIGQGSLRVEALTYRLVCLNGAIHEAAVRQAHLGRGARGQDVLEDAREFFRTETRQADDRAFFLKVQDAVSALFNQGLFEKRLDKMKAAKDQVIDGDPVRVVEATARRFGLGEEERGGIMKHLIAGGDLSSFGLAQAVTRASQDVQDYTLATEMEAIGGKLLELPQKDWKSLAQGIVREVPV